MTTIQVATCRRRGAGRRAAAFSTVLFGTWLLLAPGRAGRASAGDLQNDLSEYQVKAAFLYNIAKFVEWPREAFNGSDSPFVVCVIGEDPFERSLDEAVAGKAIDGRIIAVRRLVRNQAPAGCHLLFVSSSEEKMLAVILEYSRRASILTVGEMDRFAERGGHIQFVIEANRVGFAINIASAEQAGLRISSRLLALAKVVDDGSR